MKIGRISSLAVTVSFSLSFVAALRPANPVNLTVIGLRPVNLSTDLVNKDTGDGPGDLFFWITGWCMVLSSKFLELTHICSDPNH